MTFATEDDETVVSEIGRADGALVGVCVCGDDAESVAFQELDGIWKIGGFDDR